MLALGNDPDSAPADGFVTIGDSHLVEATKVDNSAPTEVTADNLYSDSIHIIASAGHHGFYSTDHLDSSHADPKLDLLVIFVLLSTPLRFRSLEVLPLHLLSVKP